MYLLMLILNLITIRKLHRYTTVEQYPKTPTSSMVFVNTLVVRAAIRQ
jgi:hypothetical protein